MKAKTNDKNTTINLKCNYISKNKLDELKSNKKPANSYTHTKKLKFHNKTAQKTKLEH